MGKFMRICCRRESYAIIIGIIYTIFAILALALPWYGIAATQMPQPWDSMTAVFYWSGYEGGYAPPLIGNQRTYYISWSSMASTMPKDVYMTSMAMSFLGLFSMLLLMAMLLFGFVLPATSRVIQLMFFGYYKWVVVILCFINWAVSLLAWTVFFAFPHALSSANICPGSTSYNPAPFPYTNGTKYFEPLWCDSYANNRSSFGTNTIWIWGPSIGWILSIIAYVLSNFVLFIMLTVPTKNDDKDYQRLK